ncbi:MAG: ABC transporter substrate-binding protein [Desulfamplus sp.]|nr:ABC transporter substrate-binding protein [Desulfamplus sp.]
MVKLPALRIGHLRILDHLMLGFAYNGFGEDLFKQTTRHLITPVHMGSWSQIKKAFCDGDLHGAFIPLPEVVHLFDSGIKLKVLVYDCRPGACLVSNGYANIENIRDFKGKTVLISHYMSIHHLLFYRLMASVGLKAGLENDSHTDVYIEVVPPFIAPEMLKYDHAGYIGGCFIEEPFGSMVINDCRGKIMLSSSQLWTDHPGSVLVLHDYVIDDYRSHVMDFIHLMVASSKFIFRGSNYLHRLSQHFFNQDHHVIEKMFSTFIPKKAASIMPDIKSLESINQFMVKDMGIMKNIINMNELVDTSFALEAETIDTKA